MNSTLTIQIAASSRALLTASQLRAAAGLADSDTSQDTALAAIGLTVADTISDWCNIAGDGVTPVTLRQETLVETFRLTSRPNGCAPLILSRRFLGTVSVVENGVALADTDFAINAGSGLLTRLSDDVETHWPAGKIVATYQAGFATVPTPLADVAAEMLARKLGVARDPLTRSERIETVGVETVERQFWVSEANDADVTPDMAMKLNTYRTWAAI